jgi:CIC family chloride channel protein
MTSLFRVTRTGYTGPKLSKMALGAAIGETGAWLAPMPGETQALWALMEMEAILSGSLGVPLTAIRFSLELTHALPALLPLASACVLLRPIR